MTTDEIRAAVYAELDAMGISYRSVEHEAAATMADCEAVSELLGAVSCKNYFLTTKSRKHWCLCITRPEAKLRTADVSKQVGTPRLTFAGEDDLMERLHVYPGCVSPMGLIFDSAREVRLLADRALRDWPELAFHPCDNTRSLAMSARDFFEVFLPAVGKQPEWIDVHDFLKM